MKTYRLLIPTLWAISLILTACAPTPTPFPAASTSVLPSAALPNVTASNTPQPDSTYTPQVTASVLPRATTPTAFTPTPITPTSFTPTITRTPWPTGAPALASLAQQHNLFLGASLQTDVLTQDSPYRPLIVNSFHIIGPNNAMSLCTVWPERARWNFEESDALVQFAQDNKLRVRGRILVEDGCIPDWIKNGSFSRTEASSILKEYITTLLGRYNGKVAYWSVFTNTSDLDSGWSGLIGPNYVQLAFNFAHNADPRAKLVYEDVFSSSTFSSQADALANVLKNLQYQGVPFHAAAIQMDASAQIDPQAVAQTIERINALGLDSQLTIQIHSQRDNNENTEWQQAEGVQQLAAVCLKARKCPVFLLQTDPAETELPDSGWLLFDDQYHPNAIYAALYSVLQK